ncbi:MAG: expansin EXLX1 family cellulose-binding protein [Cyanobacteria bacterium P01_A01_bin.83]
MKELTQDLIQTSFVIETEWDQGFTGRLDLSNTGEDLRDWTIKFESQFEIYPEQIWGAEIVSRQGNIYTLQPVDYNQTIYANQGTSITFNANKINDAIISPQNFQFDSTLQLLETKVDNSLKISNDAPLDRDNSGISSISSVETELATTPEDNLPVDVDFNLISNWGNGFQGEISITNNTGSNIDTWNLKFDLTNYIDNLWDGDLKQYQNGNYVVANTAWNREISAGETITIGFTGEDALTIEPQNFELDGFVFDSPSVSQSIYTYENADLAPELELNQVYQGRATFYDAANPAGGIGASGFDTPISSELHKIVAMNNIQWNGSEASGAFMQVSGPKQREGAAPIIVQVADLLVERADGMDMSAEAFAKVADPIDGTVNIEYELVGPGDDYVTAYGHSIGDGIVVETIEGTNPYYGATRLNNHRYPIESVELIADNGNLIELNRESDNRFVMSGNYPLNGVQDLLVTDIFGQQVTLDDINITNSSVPDTVTGEQFAMI